MDVAVNGTHNVLSSVAKNKESIRRVLVTSSFAGGHMCVRDGAIVPVFAGASEQLQLCHMELCMLWLA